MSSHIIAEASYNFAWNLTYHLFYLIPFYSISGIYVDSWNEMGQTPLFVAAFLKKLAIVKMLLNLHADPNIRVQSSPPPTSPTLW